MTRDTQAIDALMEAVRDGAISTSLIEDAMDTSWEAVMVLAAFDGEMDAALCLLGHLLPGCKWGRQWDGRMWVQRPEATADINQRHYGEGDDPARALLLATLKAWKETMK